MNLKVKVGLLVLMVALVMGVIILDRSAPPPVPVDPGPGAAGGPPGNPFDGLPADAFDLEPASAPGDQAILETGSPGPAPVTPPAPATPTVTVPTPAPVAPVPLPPIEPAPAARTYTVKAGDNLWTIAEELYGAGKGHMEKAIRRANNISDVLALKPGMTLTVPEAPAAAPAPTPAAPAPAAPAAAGDGSTYTVVSGDTLSGISSKVYGRSSRWKTIFDANRGLLSSPTDLSPGMVLTIPATPSVAAPSADDGASAGVQPVPDAGSYKVGKNESFWKISEKLYGTPTRWKDLYEANKTRLGLRSHLDLKEGDVLDVSALDRGGVSQ